MTKWFLRQDATAESWIETGRLLNLSDDALHALRISELADVFLLPVLFFHFVSVLAFPAAACAACKLTCAKHDFHKGGVNRSQ